VRVATAHSQIKLPVSQYSHFRSSLILYIRQKFLFFLIIQPVLYIFYKKLNFIASFVCFSNVFFTAILGETENHVLMGFFLGAIAPNSIY